MVNFRRSSANTPRYLSRSYQRRLLMLVLGLCLVFFLMFQAAKPETWAWLFQGVEVARQEEIDTRFRPQQEPEGVPGAFVARADPADGDEQEAAEGYYPGVKPALLARVRDNTVFRRAEHDAFFHLLEILDEAEEDELVQASQGRVTYVQLYRQTNEYRGKLVNLSGNIRRARLLQSPKNDYGIEQYYELVLQPDDNLNSVVTVYALQLPEEFPLDDAELREHVEVTGFPFKRLAYRAQDTIRTMPLVLSRTVHWVPAVVEKAEPIDFTLMAIVVGGVALVSLLLVGWVFGRKPGEHELPDYVRRNMKKERVSLDETLRGEEIRPGADEAPSHLKNETHGKPE